jgi:hypothetical protein
VAEKNISVQNNDSKTTLPLREEVAFSSLYTPESRRNSLPESARTRTQTNKYPPLRGSKTSKKKIFSFIGFSAIFISFILYTFVFSSATIEVRPVRTSVNVDQIITVPAIDIQIGNDVIVVIATSTASKDVPRRGATKVETKASGTIVIYNSFDASPQKLITNTRFESTNGKIYRIAESVTVPGAKGGVPGSIEAVVYADSVGAEYNAASSDFTIPGFKGTQRYSKFSAKTKSVLSGGASGTQDAVADEDIAAAHASLLDEVKKKITLEIEAKKPNEDFIYLPDATLYTSTDNRKDLITDPKLQYQETIIAKAFYIKKDYLAKKILQNTNYKEEDNFVLEDTKQLVFGVPVNISSLNKEDITFTVTGSPNFISKLDEVTIAAALAGTEKSDFESKMKQFRGVEQAKPKLSPFWSLSFPKDTKKIKVQLVQ